MKNQINNGPTKNHGPFISLYVILSFGLKSMANQKGPTHRVENKNNIKYISIERNYLHNCKDNELGIDHDSKY